MNSPPGFLFVFFVSFYGNSLRHRFFVCNSHVVLGESSGYCTKTNKSGQILDQRWKIFFVIFTKLIPRRFFFVYATILVLMVLLVWPPLQILILKKSLKSSLKLRVQNCGKVPVKNSWATEWGLTFSGTFRGVFRTFRFSSRFGV